MKSDLPSRWRERAAMLRPYNSGAAIAWESAADELEREQREYGDELLNLRQAARETGYNSDYLGILVRKSRLRNHGRKNSPRIRRGDLPMKVAEAPGLDPSFRAEAIGNITTAARIRKERQQKHGAQT